MWRLFRRYFKLGDYVKCIDDRNWNRSNQSFNLEVGKVYKIINVIRCPNCGRKAYDIGCRFTDVMLFTRCSSKNEHNFPGMGIHLAGHFRFERVKNYEESVEEMKAEITISLKEENYERAAELQKKIEKKI